MAQTQIILLERVEHLGQMGDIVKVKPGYARNYLLPQNKALRASKANIAIFEQKKTQLEADNLKLKSEAEDIKKRMEGTTVAIIRAASQSGQLYGSVNSNNIAQAVSDAGFSINRNQVIMAKPIKTLGFYDYTIRLHPEVTSDIHINVAQSDEEAKLQAQRVAQGLPAFISAQEEEQAIARQEREKYAQAAAKAAAERESGDQSDDAKAEKSEEKQED